MSIFIISPDGDDTNPGTVEQPWKSLHHAAEVLQPGQTVYLRAGVYPIQNAIRPRSSGRPGAWITYASFPGEQAVIDAAQAPHQRARRGGSYNEEWGAFILDKVSYVCLQGLRIINSYWSGICVIDSQYIGLFRNITENTFCSGISIWDTSRQGVCHHHCVAGNIVIKANTWDRMPPSYPRARRGEPPHEAISIAGANDFEVAYNHVYNCDKEGIDVKETSKRGVVHHNYVHYVDRQGLYADAWFGVLEDVEFSHNVVHDCNGMGIAISTEDREIVRNLHIHHNLVYNNACAGLYFSRWGKDGPRENIHIHHNTFHHNGYGTPAPGETYRYGTGGIYLYSANIAEVSIHDNIVSDNRGFQIGYSDHYLHNDQEIETALERRGIRIERNLLAEGEKVVYPIRVGFPGHFANVSPYNGAQAICGNPCFRQPEAGDFGLLSNSPAILPKDFYGALPPEALPPFWWQENFPPTEPVNTLREKFMISSA